MFVGKAGAHPSEAPVLHPMVGSWLTHKDKTRLITSINKITAVKYFITIGTELTFQRIPFMVKYIPSSLVCLFASNQGKKVHNIDFRCQCYETLILMNAPQAK